ncbi:MAG: DUF1559 family PulG-like putative transporter [Planctomycetota bacterium]|jgi:hypothetical protein
MQFSLQTLLLVVLVVATALAAFGVVGIVLALFGLGLCAFLASCGFRWEALGVVAFLAFLGVLSLSYQPFPDEPHALAYCNNNLKQLALSMHTYRDEHGSFPPAYIPDKNGKPMHSWRVLLLPYMEGGALYKQYDFSEPWDGPNNRRLAAQMPDVYRCEREEWGIKTNITHYVAVTGPKAAWPGSEPMDLDDIRDGPDSTLLLIEIPKPGVHWMEPKDLTLEEALAGLSPKSGPSILAARDDLRWAKGKACSPVAFVDGSVCCLPNDIPTRAFESLLTADGGELVDRGRHDLITRFYRARRQRRKFQAFAVLAFVASLALLVHRVWRHALVCRRSTK